MLRWTPEKKWKDCDVYIIGGGPSLKGFDWALLHNKLTIGCNDAYELGEVVCNVCIFGDAKWFNVHKNRLNKFKGAVFTNVNKLKRLRLPWIYFLDRKGSGLHTDATGWNNNTGATAINLALLLGARRVYLLGFDMKLADGESNWHPNNIDKPNSRIYADKFLPFFDIMKKDLKKFPGAEIINVTDDSALDAFPKIGTKEFWSKRK